MLIQRAGYLNFLIEWKEQQIIKVITGIRRCGKSTLFELFQEHLLSCGVAPEQIIAINFEDVDNEPLCGYKELYEHVKGRMVPGKMNHIFLDEIQHVAHYEKAVDSLFVQKNADVYITGSNAYFMSGELATLLSGRYVELKMLPLSFAEYVSAFTDPRSNLHAPGSGRTTTQKSLAGALGIPEHMPPIRRQDFQSKEDLYRDYIYNSSFPYTVGLRSRKQIHTYLDGLYNTVVLNDIVERRRIQDPAMLKSVIRFLFDNIGNTCSAKKIADAMTSAGRKIASRTVENYLEGITDSLLMYKVGRFDIKGKEYLRLLDKYYLADIGLRYYLLGTRNVDQGHILENVVFLELLRRGYQVYIGKIGPAEVDFVAQDCDGNIEYYQVAVTVREERTLTRELASLDSIPDHNPKYLLVMDNDPPASHNGIRQKFVLDWLLEK